MFFREQGWLINGHRSFAEAIITPISEHSNQPILPEDLYTAFRSATWVLNSPLPGMSQFNREIHDNRHRSDAVVCLGFNALFEHEGKQYRHPLLLVPDVNHQQIIGLVLNHNRDPSAALLTLYHLAHSAFFWRREYSSINPHNADTIPIKSEADTAQILVRLQKLYPHLEVLHEPVVVTTDNGGKTVPDFLLYDRRLGIYDGPTTAIESKVKGKQASRQEGVFWEGAPDNWDYRVSNDNTRQRARTILDHARALLGSDLIAQLESET